MNADDWDELAGWGATFTCYSSALAAWLAAGGRPWQAPLDTALHLVLTEEDDDLFGFAHFPPGLAVALGLERRGSDDAEEAVAAIRRELEAGTPVIVHGDGMHLPWHVAHGRRHVPHWFTLRPCPDGPELIDPFDCQTELGRQRPNRQFLGWDELPAILEGLPGGDAVLALREAFALGEDDRPLAHHRYGWHVAAPVAGERRPPQGLAGPDALRRLARHFREKGDQAWAYRQADDLWSVARHRSLAARRAAADSAGAILPGDEFAALAARWNHIAPLLMQARLGVQAGRAPSASLPDTLEQIAVLETVAFHYW